jgi:high-affinity iron transporter
MRVAVSQRWLWIGLGVAALGLLAWQIATASGGTPDPTEARRLSDGAVVVDSGILVLREGLECILVLAAVTASLFGANKALRRPVALGGLAAFGATVVTWFAAAWFIGELGWDGLQIQAATGLLAIVVLLVVMNWFFHNVYWTGWISHHHKRRKRLLAAASDDDIGRRRLYWGMGLLGFSIVYREGFEIVLFLQNLRLQHGAGIVLAGAGLGLALTLGVGAVTFAFQQKLPYKKMLIATGILLAVVLVVMVGEEVQEMQLAGWLPTTTVGVAIPGWMGLWLAVFPTVEGLVAQALALVLVLGSYFLAEELRVKRPRRAQARARAQGRAVEAPARRAPEATA